MTKLNIKLNEAESYTIEVPDEITKKELSYLADRFYFILKMINKDVLMADDSQTISSEKAPRIRRHNFDKSILRDREKVVEIWKAYYSEDIDYRQKVFAKYNIPDKKYVVHGSLWVWKKKHNITAQECGLKYFPGRGLGYEVEHIKD